MEILSTVDHLFRIRGTLLRGRSRDWILGLSMVNLVVLCLVIGLGCLGLRDEFAGCDYFSEENASTYLLTANVSLASCESGSMKWS